MLANDNRSSSWNCVETAEEKTHLIKASQSAYYVTDMLLSHVKLRLVNFSWKLQPFKPFHDRFHIQRPKMYKGNIILSSKQKKSKFILQGW